MLPFNSLILQYLTAGTGCAATGAASSFHLEIRINLKTNSFEINRYRLCLRKKIFIGNKFITVKFKNFIHIIWFIQNQCQRRSASATLVEEKPNWLYLFFILEKLRNLLLRCFRNIQHENLQGI